MESGLQYILDFIVFAVLQSLAYGAVALVLSLVAVYFLWKEKYLYREDYIRQGLTYMTVTTWVLAVVFFGLILGGVRAAETKIESSYSEFLAPEIRKQLPQIKVFMDKGLSSFSDKPLSVEEASRKVYLEIRVFLKEYEFSEEDQAYADLLDFPGTEAVAQWVIKGILKALIISAMNESDSQLLEDSLVFSYGLIQNMDLKNVNESIDKALSFVFIHHLKGLFWSFYLQLFLVFLLVSCLFALDLWISRPSPVSL